MDNLEELNFLNGRAWENRAIRVNEDIEIKDHLSKIDLYFCPLFNLWPRPLPRPTVVTIPDIQEVFYPQFFSATERSIRAHHYPESMRVADRIVTLSSFSKKTFVEKHQIPPEKITVAYPCPDQRYLDADRNAQNPGFPLNSKGFLLYPANNWPHKNHEALLGALVWLKKERNLEVPLVFTGTQLSDGYPLQQRIDAFGLSAQCTFFGYLTTEEMAYLYLRAKGLIFPSLFEGFGLPLVEAMAAGCPVLCSDAASLPEIGGDAVAYFSPDSPERIGQAIEQFWNNQDFCRQLIEKGRKRSAFFSAENFAAAHLKAFSEAVQSYRFSRYAWHSFYYHPQYGRRLSPWLERISKKLMKGF